jgi:large subunit ribosomal protein L13
MKLRKTTYMAKKEDAIPRRWLLVNAQGQVLGRLSTKIARILMGKHRPGYTPHVDTGEYVVVTHAGDIRLTGTKAKKKVYTSYTGYPGGLRTETAGERLANKPDLLLRESVRKMLPKNRLARRMLTKLKVYGAELPEHEFKAQGLTPIEL